jgi:hypothetical protein
LDKFNTFARWLRSLTFAFGEYTRMTNSRRSDMILVYDLRRDRRYREQILSGCERQWQAYLRGERKAHIAEGRIVDLFFAPYEGEHMFRIDEGVSQSSWVRHGDQSWYAVGRHAKIERVVFRAPHPIGEIPVITRIWIGQDAEPSDGPNEEERGQPRVPIERQRRAPPHRSS